MAQSAGLPYKNSGFPRAGTGRGGGTNGRSDGLVIGQFVSIRGHGRSKPRRTFGEQNAKSCEQECQKQGRKCMKMFLSHCPGAVPLIYEISSRALETRCCFAVSQKTVRFLRTVCVAA